MAEEIVGKLTNKKSGTEITKKTTDNNNSARLLYLHDAVDALDFEGAVRVHREAMQRLRHAAILLVHLQSGYLKSTEVKNQDAQGTGVMRHLDQTWVPHKNWQWSN